MCGGLLWIFAASHRDANTAARRRIASGEGQIVGPGPPTYFCLFRGIHCFCCVQLSCRGPRTVSPARPPRALRFARRDPRPPARSSTSRPAGRPATGSRGSPASPLLPRARQRHVLLPAGITVRLESLWSSAAAAGGRRRSVHRAPGVGAGIFHRTTREQRVVNSLGDEVVRPAPLPCA